MTSPGKVAINCLENSSPTSRVLDLDDVSPPQCDAVPGRDVEENAAKAPEMGRFRGNPCSLSFHLAVFLFWDPETSFFWKKR